MYYYAALWKASSLCLECTSESFYTKYVLPLDTEINILYTYIIIHVGQNKPLFLQTGVVDVGLSLLMQSTQAHIQVKAFSLLRLLAEKQGTYIHN